MNVLELIAGRRQTAAEQRNRRWRELIEKAVGGKTLAPAEIDELEMLNREFNGPPLEDVVELFQRHAEYTEQIKARKSRESAKDTAGQKWTSHERETQRIQAEHEKLMRERQETGRLLRGAFDAADEALARSIQAEDLKRTLERYDLAPFFGHEPARRGAMHPAHEAWERNEGRCRESGITYADFVRNYRIAAAHGV